MSQPNAPNQRPSALPPPPDAARTILLARGGWSCPSIVERLAARGARAEDARDLGELLRALSGGPVSCILLGTRFAGEIGLEVARLLASERSGRHVPIVMIAEDGMLLRPSSLVGTRVRYVVTPRVHARDLADCVLRCVAESEGSAARAA